MSGCAALIVAAGRGRRLGGPLPKQYRELAGQPILRRTLRAFLEHDKVDRVRVVIHPDDRDLYDMATAGFEPGGKLLSPVPGGASRQDSVRLGLESLELHGPALVLIHDAARPFVSSAVIDGVMAALADHPGAIPALPVVDTLKRGTREGVIAKTVPRDDLWRAQTPQGFRFVEILDAHRRAAGSELTDDAAVLEHAGLVVALVEGSEENMKVTTEDDLNRAQRRLGGGETRVGTGFDVHRLGEGDHVILCGIRIPFEQGLIGHSDADVALHALTDAILGAIGAGDIGVHFPPTEQRWRGAASRIFLEKARDLVAERGGEIVNVDVTVICQAPRVSPHRTAMAAFVAEVLGIADDRVSIKGTTTERLGFTGRGEGIAAQAAATVRV